MCAVVAATFEPGRRDSVGMANTSGSTTESDDWIQQLVAMAQRDGVHQAADDELLYHYTTKERALENIFPDMRMRMGPLRGMADPRERGAIMATAGGVITEKGRKVSDSEIARAVNRNIKDVCRVACFSHEKGYKDIERSARVTDSDRGWGHDRMWDQYAGHHTGICLVFDKAKLLSAMEDHFAGRGTLLYGPIIYELFETSAPDAPAPYTIPPGEIGDIGLDEHIRRHRKTYAQHFYFVKNPDWSSENEYRFVWLGDDESCPPEEFVSIEGCLRAVCVGAYFPAPYRRNVADFGTAHNIGMYEIWYSAGGLIRAAPTLFGPYDASMAELDRRHSGGGG